MGRSPSPSNEVTHPTAKNSALVAVIAFVKTNLKQLQSTDPIHSAGQSVILILSSRPTAVIELAHQKLHATPFREVSLCWRRAYEEGSLWKIVRLLEKYIDQNEADGKSCDLESECFKDIIETCDMALIMTGAPGRKDLIDRILASLEFEDDSQRRSHKRQRVDDFSFIPQQAQFASSSTASIPCLNYPVDRVAAPSLQWFGSHMHNTGTPVVLTNTLEHWPALCHWTDPRYWIRRTHGGKRLVPIELGRSYTDDGWGQKIMPFGDYLREHLIETTTENTKAKGYLAQHDLLAQIPALRADLSIPDYCYVDPPRPAASNQADDARSTVSEDDIYEPLLNIWLGPEQTISPAHTDPHHNILAQVVGRKYIRLFAPSETEKMYPLSGGSVDMGNTSSVDVGAFVDAVTPTMLDDRAKDEREEQLVRFPHFREAEFVEAILEPGDCLYIPRGWWHYVRSMEVSCSVSFWWN